MALPDSSATYIEVIETLVRLDDRAVPGEYWRGVVETICDSGLTVNAWAEYDGDGKKDFVYQDLSTFRNTGSTASLHDASTTYAKWVEAAVWLGAADQDTPLEYARGIVEVGAAAFLLDSSADARQQVVDDINDAARARMG